MNEEQITKTCTVSRKERYKKWLHKTATDIARVMRARQAMGREMKTRYVQKGEGKMERKKKEWELKG